MATTRYAQNVATEQIPFANYPGGGPIPGPQGGGFNDPGVEIADVREVTAIYQMFGNEVANDIINIYLAQPGTSVSVGGSVTSSGVATTCTLLVGDDDTTGYGMVSSGVAFSGAWPLTVTAQGADPSRYSGSINVAAATTTTPTSFSGGSSLADPHVIGTNAVEQAVGSGSGTGTGVTGSWIQATFATLATVVPGKVLVFRLKLLKP